MSAMEKRQSSPDEERWKQYYLSIVEEGREVMYHVTKALYKGGRDHPRDYCQKHFRGGESHYFSSFKREQIKMLDLWPKDTPYDIAKASSKWDISLHYSFQVSLCGLGNHQIRSLKKMISIIKRHRDNVSHGSFVLSQTELLEIIHELERVYNFALDFVSNNYNVNLENTRNRIINRLCNRLFIVSPKDLMVVDETWNFREEEKYLKKMYAKRRLLIPAGIKECKAVPVSKLFYNRNLLFGDGELLQADDATTVAVTDSMSSKEECRFAVLMNQIKHVVPVKMLINFFMENKFADHMIITGGAGCGKSTLLLYILDQWCSGLTDINGLYKIELVLYVDLTCTQSSTLISLLQKELMKSTCLKIHVNKIIQRLQERAVLWLLDGFDGTSPEIRNLTEDIVQKFPRVITTARKEFLPTLRTYKDGRTITGQFEVLAHEMAKELARNVVSVIGNKNAQEKFEDEYLKEQVDNNGFKQCLLSSPLEVTRLCVLFVKRGHVFLKVETISELHQEILNMRAKELAKKIQDKTSRGQLEVEEKLSQWLLKVGEVVWQCCSRNVKFLSEWNVKYLFGACEDYGFNSVKTEMMSTFFEVRECDNCNILGSTTAYSVPDDSVLLFLAAEYQFSKLTGEEEDLSLFISEKVAPCQFRNNRICQILMNFIGILSIKKKMCYPWLEYILKLLYFLGYSEWLTIINEGKCNSRLSGLVAEILGRGIAVPHAAMIFWWNPLLALLQQKKLKFIKVDLESKPNDLYATIALLRVMCDYVGSICFNCSWSLCDFGVYHVNDEILKAAAKHKTCILTCFHGSLSAYAIDKLIPPSIESLELRITNLQQLTALRQYFWDHGLPKLHLVLDFPKTLYPGEVRKLDISKDEDDSYTPRGCTAEFLKNCQRRSINDPKVEIQKVNNRVNNAANKGSVNELVVCIPRVDNNHVFWALRLLQNISDCEYDEVYFKDCQITEDGKRCLLESIYALQLKIKKVIILRQSDVDVIIPQKSFKTRLTSQCYRIIYRPIDSFSGTMIFISLILLCWGIYGFLREYPDFLYFFFFNIFFLGTAPLGIIVFIAYLISVSMRRQ